MSDLWYMNYYIDDKKIIPKTINSLVVVKNRESYVFMAQLINYIITISNNKWVFPRILKNDNGVLYPDISLSEKSKEENFQDIKHSVQSFRNIIGCFLSSGALPKSKNNSYEQLINDFDERADILEFFLLNNPNIKKPNQKSYYSGRLELDILRIIQELFLISKSTNQFEYQWLSKFNSPYEIWFITIAQLSYMTALSSFTEITAQSLVKQSRKAVKNAYEQLEKDFYSFYKQERLNILEAVIYTIGTTYIYKEHTQIRQLYLRYLESIRKQSNLIEKGKVRMLKM